MGRPGLLQHRKFRRLSRALGSPIVARGALELMWDACYEAGEDYLGTADDIEALIGWTGQPGTVALALVACGVPEGQGFIEPLNPERSGGAISYRVHDLWHHAPEYVTKRRKREMERQQKSDPALNGRSAPNGGQRTESLNWQIGVDVTPAPAPAPAPAPQKISSTAHSATEPPAVAEFSTVGKPSVYRLSEAQVAEWAALFPSLDVRQEVRNALAWVRATPGRRKTAKGMPKFLVGWFTRSNDRGRPAGTSAPKPVSGSAPALVSRECPHIERCASQQICDGKNLIPHKYPVKAAS